MWINAENIKPDHQAIAALIAPATGVMMKYSGEYAALARSAPGCLECAKLADDAGPDFHAADRALPNFIHRPFICASP